MDKNFLTQRGVTSVKGMKINHAYPYDISKMQKAIANGMVILLRYKGAEDDLRYGRERVIWPMVMGRSKENKPLLRGYQVQGWSVSAGKRVSKEWRMFRTDRIQAMTFTGNFFQTAPSGYNSDDPGIANISFRANMDNVLKRQKALMDEAQIYDLKDRTIEKPEEIEDDEEDERKRKRTLNKTGVVETVIVTDQQQELDLEDPYSQNLFGQDDAFIACFLKPERDDKLPIVLVGATGEKGVPVDIKSDNFLLGRYTIIDVTDHTKIKEKTEVYGRSKFPMYLFQDKPD